MENLEITLRIYKIKTKTKYSYNIETMVSFTENQFGFSTGEYTYKKPCNTLEIIGDKYQIDFIKENNFYNYPSMEFKKDLADEECLFFFNLTKLQIFNRLLNRNGFFPTYRNNKMYLIRYELCLFGLPRKRENKKLIPKKIQPYFKIAADDLESYFNSYENTDNEFNPRKEIEYRKKYPKKLESFLDMGEGIKPYQYVCKCGYKADYKDFILGSNAGFAGTFIQKCPKCLRKRGDMFDRLFGSMKDEDFEVKLETRNNHFYDIKF